jgi:hypothetical protein
VRAALVLSETTEKAVKSGSFGALRQICFKLGTNNAPRW